MTVALGPMGLLATEPEDVIEDYVNGLQPDGGEWTNWNRLSVHDHSGGTMGAAVAVTIPPGSITSGQLDPSVLGPYALTDGSKPFTGLVTMQADAVVRDRLSFGEQGTALAPDAYWERAGVNALRTGGNVGVGVAPAAWGANWNAIGVGAASYYAATKSGDMTQFRQNSYDDGTTNRAIVPGASALTAYWNDGSFHVMTAPAVAAGAAQTFTTRLTVDQSGGIAHGAGRILEAYGTQYWFENTRAGGTTVISADSSVVLATKGGPISTNPRLSVAQNGTVTLTPDAGQNALMMSFPGTNMTVQPGTQPSSAGITAQSGPLQLYGSYVGPWGDNGNNLGSAGVRWSTLFAVQGTINTSSVEMKQDITPLDPAAALAAVLATDPVVFDYTPPVKDAAWYELPDDPELAEATLYQRLTNEPLEVAARHQAGFVLQDATGQYHTDPLFETGEGQSNAANSLGVVLAALHEIDRRLTALEGN